MYEQHGDAAAAQSVRDLGREYAKIVDDQTSGPARTMLKNASPEKIVSTIVSNGAKSQSAVESLMRNISKDGQATLRDSVLKEIYRKSSLPDGTIDMAKAQKAFNGMGDAAKTLFGDSHADTSKFLDTAAREQAAKTAAANQTVVAIQNGGKGSRKDGWSWRWRYRWRPSRRDCRRGSRGRTLPAGSFRGRQDWYLSD